MNTQAVFCLGNQVEPNRPMGLSAIVTSPAFDQILTPWHCFHHDGVSQIEAYVAHNGKRHIIAETYGAPGIDAEVTATAIVEAINKRSKMEEIIKAMLSAFDLYLESSGLSWEAEQEMDIVSRKARRLLSGEWPEFGKGIG